MNMEKVQIIEALKWIKRHAQVSNDCNSCFAIQDSVSSLIRRIQKCCGDGNGYVECDCMGKNDECSDCKGSGFKSCPECSE